MFVKSNNVLPVIYVLGSLKRKVIDQIASILWIEKVARFSFSNKIWNWSSRKSIRNSSREPFRHHRTTSAKCTAISMPISSTSCHQQVKRDCHSITHDRCSSADEVIEQVQLVLQHCEASPDERRIRIWTVLVKALMYARPALVEHYMPTVRDRKQVHRHRWIWNYF